VAVSIAVVLATSGSTTAIKYRNVVTHDAQSAIKSLEGLIGANTK